MFEYEPRVTHPISHLVEIFDIYCRSWLWKFVTPHPSLSLTHLSTLFLAPWLLYLALRNIGICKIYALAGTSLFLTNSGRLSLLVLGFSLDRERQFRGGDTHKCHMSE